MDRSGGWGLLRHRGEENDRRPLHIALLALSKTAVDDFHRIGLLNGGRDNGAPEDCGRGAYGAYLLDPDGNNIEAIFRAP